jgi:hypothetical protein
MATFWLCSEQGGDAGEHSGWLEKNAPYEEHIFPNECHACFNVTSSPIFRNGVADKTDLIKAKEPSSFRHKNSDGLRGHPRPQCDGSARFEFDDQQISGPHNLVREYAALPVTERLI